MDCGRKLFGIAALAALGVTAFAEQREVRRIPPPVSPIRLTTPWRPSDATATTRVVGSVVDIRQVPVSFARVRLRDLLNGKIIGEGAANDRGEYEFILEEPGTYVAEMILANNYILGLSNAVSIRMYETQTTVIRLPGRWNYASRSMSAPVSATAFFGAGSAASMASATIAMAAAQDVRPVDVEPISPNK